MFKSFFQKSLIALLLVLPSAALANDIVGNWLLYMNGAWLAVISMQESPTGYMGVVAAENTPSPSGHLGKTVVFNLKADGNGEYSGGTVIDPTTNKSYQAIASVSGDVLQIRAYIGHRAFGQTQTWYRMPTQTSQAQANPAQVSQIQTNQDNQTSVTTTQTDTQSQ